MDFDFLRSVGGFILVWGTLAVIVAFILFQIYRRGRSR